jgi:hypothetical protein
MRPGTIALWFVVAIWSLCTVAVIDAIEGGPMFSGVLSGLLPHIGFPR